MPFLTIYTPTFKRPRGLAACMASVERQTAADDIEHFIVADYVGVGVGGMFTRVQQYVGAVHGDYVYLLADDDVLADDMVVWTVRAFARARGNPPVMLVSVNKGGVVWPSSDAWPPRCGAIDLGCILTRADVWTQHAGHYGNRYEGDYDFMQAVAASGYSAQTCSVLFACGAVSAGRAEVGA